MWSSKKISREKLKDFSSNSLNIFIFPYETDVEAGTDGALAPQAALRKWNSHSNAGFAVSLKSNICVGVWGGSSNELLHNPVLPLVTWCF